MCSATIDQIRLRLATTLPVEFQNVSSSGLQSEIQVGSWLAHSTISFLIWDDGADVVRAQAHAGAFRGGTPVLAASQIRMIGFRSTASMASASTIQALCQAPDSRKACFIDSYGECTSDRRSAHRIENLQFAQSIVRRTIIEQAARAECVCARCRRDAQLHK